MPTVKLEIREGDANKTVEVEKGVRLVGAIEAAGVGILHRCGGYARCTTCAVTFIAGEPRSITEAERDKLAEKGMTDARLSCQILCNHDMTVSVKQTLASSGLPDPGGRTDAHITPDPVWV